MKTIIILIILFVFVGGCKPTPEELETIEMLQKVKKDQYISNLIEGMERQASLQGPKTNKYNEVRRDQHISNLRKEMEREAFSQVPLERQQKALLLREEMEREASLERQQKALLHSKEITLGMTEEQAVDLLGLPQDKNRSVGSWGVHEQWVFKKKKHNHDTYLYFENGILTSYQD